MRLCLTLDARAMSLHGSRALDAAAPSSLHSHFPYNAPSLIYRGIIAKMVLSFILIQNRQ